MVPSIVTARAALERHAEFRRVAAGARVEVTRPVSGDDGRDFARSAGTGRAWRGLLARPRPA